jgi:hypothetical protein
MSFLISSVPHKKLQLCDGLELEDSNAALKMRLGNWKVVWMARMDLSYSFTG